MPRNLIEQRYGGQHSVHALASTLGRTASAVSVHLFAIRGKLRECIEAKATALSKGDL